MPWHCLDWGRVPLAVLRLPDSERPAALIEHVRSHEGDLPPEAFFESVPMRLAEEAAVVLGFLGGAATVISLPLLIAYAALAGSFNMAVALVFVLVSLTTHPLPTLRSLHSSFVVVLLFKYFSFKFVWEGDRDLRVRSASTAPWIGYGVPHGVFPFGNLLCTAAFGLFGVEFVGTCADVVFRIPLLRWLTMLGVVSASKKSITAQLGKGVNVGLVPDGIAGIYATSPSVERVAVAKRRGAARLAVELGVVVHPAFLLGNSMCLHVWADASGVLERLSRTLRVSLMVFWGRWGLPIPRRQQVVFTFGEPVRVEKTAAPSEEAVRVTHEHIIDGLRQTYAKVAPAFGWAGRPIEFI